MELVIIVDGYVTLFEGNKKGNKLCQKKHAKSRETNSTYVLDIIQHFFVTLEFLRSVQKFCFPLPF